MSLFNIHGESLKVAYDVHGNPLKTVYDIHGNLISLIDFLDTLTATQLPSISVSGIKQGGCTDGTYLYQMCFDSNAYTTGNIIKYKISDGTYTLFPFDASIPFSHGNDMTYNPNNNHIYVCAMTADGAVIELDADDLSYVDTHYIVNRNGNTYQVWQICFDRKNNRFYSAGSNSQYLVYDSNWNLVGYFDMPEHPNATAQGCETDGDYIYRVTWNPNLIDVATVGGDYVCTITNPLSGEPENLMCDWNGNFYVGMNKNSAMFYKVALMEEDTP